MTPLDTKLIVHIENQEEGFCPKEFNFQHNWVTGFEKYSTFFSSSSLDFYLSQNRVVNLFNLETAVGREKKLASFSCA